MGELIVKLLDEIKSNYYSPVGLMLSILIVFLAFLILIGIDYSKITFLQLLIFMILISFTVIFWIIYRRLPRTKRDKIGFVVCINIEKNPDLSKLKTDFIENLQKLLMNSVLKYDFQLICYPDYYTKKVINIDIAGKYREKSEASFMIFGKGKIRYAKGKETYALELEGIVSHIPVPKEVSLELSKEFTDLFPQKTLIPKDNELFLFELTSQWAGVVAKYIIGIASMISGDLDYSISLFMSLRDEVINTHNIPALQKIKNRIPKRLVEIYVGKATIFNIKFAKNKNKIDLEQMKLYLDKIVELDRDNYPARLLWAIYYFYMKEIKKAMNEINLCKKNKDCAWIFSEAFLLAYEGKIIRAYNKYKKAFKIKGVVDIIAVESFICDAIKDEPEKYELYFCLGLINLYEKKDLNLAKRDIEIFANKLENSHSAYPIVKKILDDIESKLQVAASH